MKGVTQYSVSKIQSEEEKIYTKHRKSEVWILEQSNKAIMWIWCIPTPISVQQYIKQKVDEAMNKENTSLPNLQTVFGVCVCGWIWTT